MKNSSSYKVIFVRWLDSMGVNEWTPVEEVSTTLDITYSVGLCIRETKDHILLALSFDPETKSIYNYKKIPRVAIVGKIKTVWNLKTN